MRRLEAFHVIMAWLLLSFSFAVIFVREDWLNAPFAKETFLAIPIPLVLSMFTLGVGFIAHELSHRAVARHLNLRAEFRASWLGLALGIILAAATGILLAFPGGVIIVPEWSLAMGSIAFAGPLANLLLILPFALIWPFYPALAIIGIFVNATLAFFNLIPISILDGKYVFDWSRRVWAVLFIISLVAWWFSLKLIVGGI